MSIISFIKKVCVQTAVYWGNPVEDGFGNKIFDLPIEIKVRWEGKQRLVTAMNGKEIISKASFISPSELAIEGYIYLGTLLELDNKYDESDYLESSSYLDSDDSSYLDSNDSSYLDSNDSSYLNSDDSDYFDSDEYLESSGDIPEIVKHPKEVDGAYEIIAIDKTPLFKSKTEFIKEYFLGFRNV